MSITVEWVDSSGYSHEQECDYVEEGDNGLFLYENSGPTQLGYVPYDRLQHVIPTEQSED